MGLFIVKATIPKKNGKVSERSRFACTQVWP